MFEFDFSTLITDRTTEDVEYAKFLNSKAFSDMTDTEKSEILSSLKGAYNYTDLNRVSLALDSLNWLFNYYGYNAPGYERVIVNTGEPTPRYDWIQSDMITIGHLNAYLANIDALRDIFVIIQTTPQTPVITGKRFFFTQANDIETILFNISDAIERMKLTLWGCNEIGCGEK